jgi:hypothetical protein
VVSSDGASRAGVHLFQAGLFMESLHDLLSQLKSLPPWVVLFGIPALWFAIRWYFVRKEAAILKSGVEVSATVLHVRIDESDCLVTYTFQDQKTGRTFKRTGLLGVQASPREGSRIAVRYLEKNPGWSRLVDEIRLSTF